MDYNSLWAGIPTVVQARVCQADLPINPSPELRTGGATNLYKVNLNVIY